MTHQDWTAALQEAINEKLLVGIVLTEQDVEMGIYARKVFDAYNAKYYDSELPPTNIYISLASGDYGEFSTDPLNMWYEGTTGQHSIILYVTQIENEGHLKEVLLHEMAHEYCHIHGIKDMRNGRHTRDFSNVAKAHGLKYAADETDYMNTILNE